MRKIILILILLLLQTIFVKSDCGTQNYINDPQHWGGMNCTNDIQCGFPSGGQCYQNNCLCQDGRGKPDCSYVRKSSVLAGGLKIGLPFVGIGGIGNFIIGRNGPAIGQLILMLSLYFGCVFACVIACVAFCSSQCSDGADVVFIIIKVVVISLLSGAVIAGFIWSIVDGAFILQCRYTDVLGYALY